jgi:hypothetical protein
MMLQTHIDTHASSLPFVYFDSRQGDPGGGSTGGGKRPKPSKKGSAKKGAAKAPKKGAKRR